MTSVLRVDSRPPCTHGDPDRWFGGDEAKAECSPCPFRVACFRYAMEYAVEGVWGGSTLAERDRMRELSGQVARPLSFGCGTRGWGLEPHGTEAGYARHRRAGQPPCGPCSEGHRRMRAGRREGGAA